MVENELVRILNFCLHDAEILTKTCRMKTAKGKSRLGLIWTSKVGGRMSDMEILSLLCVHCAARYRRRKQPPEHIKPSHIWLCTTEIYAKGTLVTHAFVRTNRKGLVPWLSSLSMLHKLFAGNDDS